MTAEMIDEEMSAFPGETEESVIGVHRFVRRPGALATQEQLDGIAALLADYEEHNGPVSDEIMEQVRADAAAADAKIGRIR